MYIIVLNLKLGLKIVYILETNQADAAIVGKSDVCSWYAKKKKSMQSSDSTSDSNCRRAADIIFWRSQTWSVRQKWDRRCARWYSAASRTSPICPPRASSSIWPLYWWTDSTKSIKWSDFLNEECCVRFTPTQYTVTDRLYKRTVKKCARLKSAVSVSSPSFPSGKRKT